MTIYKFYLNDTRNPAFKLDPYLYAFTRDKDLAEEFRRTRSGKVFTPIESNISPSEFKTVMHKFPERQMTRTRFTTRSAFDQTKKASVPVVCTWDEECAVLKHSDTILIENKIHERCFSSTREIASLNVSLLKSLNQLGFFSIYKWLYDLSYVYEPINPIFSGSVGGDAMYDIRGITFDDFSVFMYLYGNTFKKNPG